MLLATVLAAAPAHAQLLTTPLGSGDRIRVTAPEIARTPIRGEFRSAAGDTIRIATEGGSLIVGVPISTVQRLEVSRGRQRMRWAKIGAGAGALTGLLLGAMSASGGSGSINESWAPLGGLIVGVPLGAAAGAAFAPERWRDHPLRLLQ